MKEKITSIGSGVCAGMSILGSWQVCHNVCLGIIAILTAIGITVTGMPLLFLTKVAVPFWIAAVVLLALGFVLAFAFHMHLSKKLLLANAGLLVAGIPFFQAYSKLFWAVGGIIVLAGIVWWVKGRK